MLDTPIEYLKGIGPQRAEVLKKELGIYIYRDLITYYPFRYVDRTRFHKVSEISEDLPHVQLRGVIDKMEIVGQKKVKRLVVLFRDNTGIVELVWFKGYNWVAQKLQLGVEYCVFGKATSFNGRYNLAHPEIELVTEDFLKQQSAFQSVYNSTEKLKFRGLDSEGIRKAQKTLSFQLQDQHIEETLSEEIVSDHKMISRFKAFQQIHFPENAEMLGKAEFRLKFDELFYIQLRLLRLNKVRANTVHGFVFPKVGKLFNEFFSDYLPFELTGAQKRVMKEIRLDMGSGRQMNRLLQGDVGSGKTLVALLSILLAIDNTRASDGAHFQACIMAPTEILAQQHFETFKSLLQEMSIEIALLTGSTKTKERKSIHSKLLSGELNILIGTHALIEDVVQFKNIGLVVIDEQHRFGVQQRAKLRDKNTSPPHMLIMTATPIPRTLAMTLYGDLDTSIIDELPPGRKAIKTMHYMESQRLRVYGFIKEQVALGRQVYIVYPLIQESEKMDYQNLQQGYDNLIVEFPAPNYQVSIVHGKLNKDQKEFEMQRFIKGETQIMVATTVIEVGVNIPNASIMIIESAERFGLSQLHQLRGRVGRGAEQSYCVLMTGYKLGVDSRMRMETMVRTNDGFEISEVDLKLRGPGDIEGTQQSGVMDLKLANLAQDGQILQLARQTAQSLLDEDMNLETEKNKVYLVQLELQQKNRQNWSKIG
ncbi:ATP-dependent DNA helicase RecG [Aurantibacillus circumpalustris]|uniref:ATP-dependent DNA helicase RecG n=1 Tax=Aurantibacillus circumpalustris TaxID=3036359 RepID=UPI00295B2E12|nr:ATP-dependent DNA helicase RecG [Aurantibacillus circumpalustris]